MPLARLRATPIAAISTCLLLLIACTCAPAAQAGNASVTFGGGSGSPLSITLSQPISYTVTAAPSVGGLFDFKGVGNVFGGSVIVSGTMTYSVNGGAPVSINVGNTGTSMGAIAPNDLLLFHNPLPGGVALGDTIVLSAGTVTTAVSVPSAAPASGSYSAILVDPNGLQIGTGTAIPEPASLSLLAACAGPLVLARRRSRTA